MPGPKQVFRRYAGGNMIADVIAAADEELEGEALLVPAMRDGGVVRRESLEEIRERSAAQVAALPERLRAPVAEQPRRALPGRLLGATARGDRVPGLAARGEEGLQERRRLAGQQPTIHLRAVVEARLAEDVEHAARGARLRIGRSVDDARHSSEHDRARAHRARLQGHIEDRVGNAPAADPLRGLAQRQHLGMGGGVGRAARARFAAAASTSPSRTTTAPIGTSSWPARSASRSARRMKCPSRQGNVHPGP